MEVKTTAKVLAVLLDMVDRDLGDLHDALYSNQDDAYGLSGDELAEFVKVRHEFDRDLHARITVLTSAKTYLLARRAELSKGNE